MNIAYFNSLQTKNFFIEKLSSNTNLFATLAHAKICSHHMLALALIKLEVLPAETWKNSRGFFHELL